ncbi:hypothetical protein LMG28688_01730 [Paraburkholderia caffeinitolerans]|uniref:Uncharacterized protein n=1 Tax=Paraburkholderia caffeinitolerans TaxID=1723730 RepID=A0A6J5FTG8_9BURK|nr:hypothetical protein LMG28688_01730 [Paraburkholderia caffeinitolerans]
MNAITNASGLKPGGRAQGAPGTAGATGTTGARGKTRRATVRAPRTSAGPPESCDANPVAQPRIDASGICLPVQKGQRIRKQMEALDAVSGRLDIRTIHA